METIGILESGTRSPFGKVLHEEFALGGPIAPR